MPLPCSPFKGSGTSRATVADHTHIPTPISGNDAPAPGPLPLAIPNPDSPLPRLTAGGKFLWVGQTKFFLHGATYGPFGPMGRNHGLPPPDVTARDLDDMRDWGANILRLYQVPPEWFLDQCAARGLRVVVSIPWNDHVDFLRRPTDRQGIHTQIREASARLAAHPATAVILVGNEIHSTLVRWLGPRRVQDFLEALIDTARAAAPGVLIGYANYPGTEFLQPGNADFTAFNVYLEERTALDRYLARLQNIAGDKPLVITEFGVDSQSHGPDRQGEILGWEHQSVIENGVAGNIIFSWTDEWHRGGQMVTGWSFGLTARSRTPRPAWHALAGGPLLPDSLLPAAPPRVSVIVCSRNGSATLEVCLESLTRLHYPNYEILLIDDGSTDAVPEITRRHPAVRYIHQEAAGLSVARNTGAAAATGAIFAYTDDDCIADPDWLTYLTRALTDPIMSAAGGPNVPPPPKTLTQACVIAAPGGPAHVLISDRLAEHIPGCNLAVKREAFESIDGFRPKYHAAGDDVDFCWRLQEAGGGIAFAPAAMVWHRRRNTVGAFLQQQRGYGKAEALLMARHSGRFGQIGGARWRGVVYQPAMVRLLQQTSRIYTGLFGYAPFQAIYQPPLSEIWWLITSFPWWLIILALAANGIWFPAAFIPAALMLLLTLAATARQAWLLRAPAPWPALRAWLILWFLMISQPLVRGWSRFVWNIRLGSAPRGSWFSAFHLPWRLWKPAKSITELAFWSESGAGRDELLTHLRHLLTEHKMSPATDDGWRDWDLEARVSPWWRIRLATVTEYHEAPRRLTRIRLGSRITVAWFVLQLLVGIICAALVPLAQLPPLWATGLFFVWSILFEMCHHRAIGRVAKFTAEAASRSGMITYTPRPVSPASVNPESD